MKALVITLRGFHVGYLGCYGNEWITSPAVNRLAADGVAFDQHLADVPEASAARRTWRTGRHHFPDASPESAKHPDPDLIEELRRRGVRTVLVVDGSRPAPEAFAAGWDRVEHVQTLTSEATFLEQVLESARTILEDLASVENWLLWIDLATLLPPWEVPAEFSDPYFHDPEDEKESEPDEENEEEPDEEDFEDETEKEEWVEDEEEEPEPDEELADEEEDPLTPWSDPSPCFIVTEDDIDFLRLQSSYAAAVSFADAGIEALREDLARLGLAEECLLVLTSDEGLALGEHGVFGPLRPWLHDERVHVPLLMRVPATLTSGREVKNVRVPALTQSIDLMPTLLEAFGASPPGETHGQSLLPLIRGETTEVRPYAICGLQLGAVAEWCLRTPAWSFLMPVGVVPDDPPRACQLYAKPEDRWEANDVLQHHLELTDHFELIVKEYVAATRQPGPLQRPVLRDVEGGE